MSDEYLSMVPDDAVVRQIECEKIRVFHSAAGESMFVSSVYELQIRLSPECEVNHIFYILPKLEEGCILGIDFLHLNNITLDIPNKEMHMGTMEDRRIVKLNQLKKKTFPLYRIVDHTSLKFDIKHVKNKSVYDRILSLLLTFVNCLRPN